MNLRILALATPVLLACATQTSSPAVPKKAIATAADTKIADASADAVADH